MTRREFRALNDADRARAVTALKRRAQELLDSGEPVSFSGRAMTADDVARAERAQRWRSERLSRPPYVDGDTSDRSGEEGGQQMVGEAGAADRRLTMDLVPLYDLTREHAVELEYELSEREDAATDDETRQRYRERRRAVRVQRRSLPLGTDLAARTGLIAAWDTWHAEIEALRRR